MRQQKKNGVGSRAAMALLFVFLYAPIFVLMVFSFNDSSSRTVWKGFTLRWYGELLQDSIILNSIYTTLLVALLSAIIATVAGTFAAIGFYNMRRRWRTPLMTINNIPMTNADIVTGVSLCLFFVAAFACYNSFVQQFNASHELQLPALAMGFGTLLIAHITFNIPYVILSVSPKLHQMDKHLVEAAQDLGCTWMGAFWKVVLPEIKPGIVNGLLIAFTMSVDDFVISYFTAGPSTSTLAMTIYGMAKKRISPKINAVSTLLFVTVLLLLIVVNLREMRQEKALKNPAAQKAPSRWGTALGGGALALLVVVLVVLSQKSGDRVVNVCGWGENIEPSLIQQFEEETGIRVNYQTAENNEAMYSKVVLGGSGYDVVVPSDYMVSRMRQEGLLAELNFDNIPNFQFIDPQYQHLTYDPENLYSVPYTWGTLGIIYNTTMVDEPITSWDALFDPKYAGQVLMINNPRDALATALMSLGYSINTQDEGEIREAYERLAQAKADGVYQSFVADEVYDKMEAGEAAIAVYYAGDFLSMHENNPDLAYVVPESGSNWFVDAMCVLADAQHKEEAEAWINFICSTSSSLANMDYIWYASPNFQALEEYPDYYYETYGEEMDPDLYSIMAAPADVLARCEAYEALPPAIDTLYKDLWTELGIG